MRSKYRPNYISRKECENLKSEFDINHSFDLYSELNAIRKHYPVMAIDDHERLTPSAKREKLESTMEKISALEDAFTELDTDTVLEFAARSHMEAYNQLDCILDRETWSDIRLAKKIITDMIEATPIKKGGHAPKYLNKAYVGWLVKIYKKAKNGNFDIKMDRTADLEFKGNGCDFVIKCINLFGLNITDKSAAKKAYTYKK